MSGRIDARLKVTGRAMYTGDLSLPGMLIGKVVRSPLPHARVLRVDAARALEIPGVFAVLTPADTRDMGLIGHVVQDRPVLAYETVRFAGDAVAAVAAIDADACEAAVQALEIDYEPLPPVLGIDAALHPGAPRLHPQGNVMTHITHQAGDVDAAMADAAHVFEETYEFPATYQYAMEPHSLLARWHGGRIEVWSSAQHPFIIRQDLAGMFHLPMSHVQVHAPYIGGGYGSKAYTKYEPLAAALAKKAGRPVKVVFSVEEAIMTDRRHAARIWIRTGVDTQGRIVARQARAWLDSGAYADNGPRVVEGAAKQFVGPYNVPAYRIDAWGLYTNTSPAGSFRAIGKPQVYWAIENQMNQIAGELGIDPLVLRRQNMHSKGAAIFAADRPLDGDLSGDIDRLAASGGYHAPMGVACGMSGGGASPVSVALVKWHPDDSATVLAASSEIGQGTQHSFATICGTILGIDPSRVRVVSSDTHANGYDRSTGASRSTTVMGTAVASACRDILAKRRDGDLEVIGVGYSSPYEGIAWPREPIFWEIGMGMADATVDPETGQITVGEYHSVADVGHAMNPDLCEGQELGSIMQGLGHTLFEELHWEDGTLTNPNLVDYRVPTFDTLPDVLTSLLVENHDGPGPFGAKGMGEAGITPVASAIAGALYRRYGLRFTRLPLTPERVWRALGETSQPKPAADPVLLPHP